MGGVLIIAIGPQNAFILRRGLRNKHVFIVTTTCFCSDIILFSLGVLALAPLLSFQPAFKTIATFLAVAFLFVYGIFSFRSMTKNNSLNADSATTDPRYQKTETRLGSFLVALALSLLNPHAIMDTAIVFGGISAQTDPELRVPLFLGAVTASCLWFYGLGYGSKKLNPFFQNPLSWKVLDFFIGCIMWLLALMLLLYEFKVL